jgi:NCS1 family nucleobase:cation symporter-1
MLSPPNNLGLMDDVDVFGTFTPEEAKRIGCAPFQSSAVTTASEPESKADIHEKVEV